MPYSKVQYWTSPLPCQTLPPFATSLTPGLTTGPLPTVISLPVHLIQAIQEGWALSICDGSYMMPKLFMSLGAAAWIIKDHATKQAMHGTTQMAGNESDVDPYCTKLQGAHMMLLGLLAFCTFYNITNGSVCLGCNSKISVRHGQGDWRKVPLSNASSNLICAIRMLKQAQLPITVNFEHVYGHLDD
jgi:hypothetical protein